MWASEKQRILDRYAARIAQHGASFEALNSGTPERRAIRFGVLADLGISSGDSVLDLGCGLGDLWPFFQDRGLDVDYTGFDINQTLIDAARERHPDVAFKVHDILEEQGPRFDWVVSTSCFNLKLAGGDNYELAERVLRTAFRHARRGVAVDFLTSYVDFPSAEGFHYEPERIFQIAKRITRRVAIRHDYPLFEFAVYLYPDFTGWNADTSR